MIYLNWCLIPHGTRKYYKKWVRERIHHKELIIEISIEILQELILEADDHVSDEKTIDTDVAELVATQSYVCKDLAKGSWTQKIPQFGNDAKRNRQELEKTCTFNISKADKIFDHLLDNKINKLPNSHIIPMPDETQAI